ncbi:hypothetical protein ABZ342_32840 [Amycolatopsis sp. NPDC005961]|uniref:hypothetical protein n=1 Tax=Amycolatopsis sp. NPDC005961 TaxID=3156720 RepID=UPI0033F07C13
MSEYAPNTSGSDTPERGKLDSGDKFPTLEELEEFEAVQKAYLTIFDQPIENFAHNPENPTDDEVQMMKDFNDANRVVTPPSFEDFFGYPDPRAPEDDPDDSTKP